MRTGILDGIELVVDPKEGNGNAIQREDPGPSRGKIRNLPAKDPTVDDLRTFRPGDIVNTERGTPFQERTLGIVLFLRRHGVDLTIPPSIWQ